MILSISIAILICVLNFLTAIIIIRINFSKELTQLNKAIFGSMAIRLVLMSIFAWAGIKIFDEYSIYYAFTLISACFILTFVEILYIHNRTNSLNLQKSFD